MDPLHLCIAMGPLCVYLLLLARINLQRRPFITTGLRDFMALSIAVSGFVIAGPLDLFMPESAAVYFRAWIWPPLISLYFLCASLIAMLMRPRLVIYNLAVEQLKPILDRTASEIDPERRWAGHSLVLPKRGIQLYVESFSAMRNIQLIATSHMQDIAGWRQLESQLRAALREERVGSNPRGFSFLFFGLVIGVMILFAMASEPLEIAQTLYEFLRL